MKNRLNEEQIDKYENIDILSKEKNNLNKKKSLNLCLISYLLIIGVLFLFSFSFFKIHTFIVNNNNIRSLIESNNNEINEDKKCLTYNKESNKCLKCIHMHNLINGICEPNYSIKAIYKTDSENENIKLISDLFLKYVQEITINDTQISLTSSYTFLSSGNHTIYILIDISSLNSIVICLVKLLK